MWRNVEIKGRQSGVNIGCINTVKFDATLEQVFLGSLTYIDKTEKFLVKHNLLALTQEEIKEINIKTCTV